MALSILCMKSFQIGNPNLKSKIGTGCHFFVFFLSIVLLCIGLAFIIVSTIIHYDSTACEKFSERASLRLGSAYFVISLLGLIALSRGLKSAFLVFFIMGIAAFLLFLAVAVTGTGIKGARLGDYLNRLQNDVTSDKNWGFIKSCMVDSQFCDSFTDGHVYAQPTSATVLEKDLTPLMFACCSPPDGCKNSTIGENDCKKWSSDANQLCYDCSSCKDRYLSSKIKQPWRSTVAFCFYSLVFTIILSCIGFFLESNVKHQQSKQKAGSVRVSLTFS